MNAYIKQWFDIIEHMRNDNTYKLAWGRAILEIVQESNLVDGVISFDLIAEKMLKYYWNQLYFFQLKQAPGKVPVVVQVTESCIQFVQKKRGSTRPIWFDYAKRDLKEDVVFYQKNIKKIAKTLVQDVSWRFQMIQGKTYMLYELDKVGRTIRLSNDAIETLKTYGFVLSQLLNYRWAQLLEQFNTSPKITQKVKGISNEKIRRNNLSQFKELLLHHCQNGVVRDFYTGELLDEHDISVDHVIPWSFMYSDDIWNLVLTSKRHNSQKSNHMVDETVIKKLEQRNEQLLQSIEHKRFKQSLQMAKEQNLVQSFYLAFRL